jgi:HlyD family secretion protein
MSGTVTVAVETQSPAPEFAAQEVEGVIRIQTLNDVMYVGRPAAKSGSETTLFRLESDGSHAQRVKVRFGASSVSSLQILEGLQPGDHVILSDMTKYDGSDRIRLE